MYSRSGNDRIVPQYPDSVSSLVTPLNSSLLDRLRNNRWISGVYHECRLRWANRRRGRPVLILQMGKVGSSTVFESLAAAGLRRAMFHVHFLNPASIDAAEQRLQDNFGDRRSANRWALYESRFVRKQVLRSAKTAVQIISLVREPVARNVSSFFANLDMYVPDSRQLFSGHVTLDELARWYTELFHEHKHPLTWFDNEIRHVFGIDVFSDEHLVSSDANVFRFRRDNVELLILRVEDMDARASQALAAFLEMEQVPLVTSNEGVSEEYGHLYRDFRRTFRPSDEYLAMMYDSKYARRFYSETEIAGFRSGWARR